MCKIFTHNCWRFESGNGNTISVQLFQGAGPAQSAKRLCYGLKDRVIVVRVPVGARTCLLRST